MFDNYDMTLNTLKENVEVLIRLVEIKDRIIIDNSRIGKTDETEKTKEEIEIYISSLKAYIHSQVEDV